MHDYKLVTIDDPRKNVFFTDYAFIISDEETFLDVIDDIVVYCIRTHKPKNADDACKVIVTAVNCVHIVSPTTSLTNEGELIYEKRYGGITEGSLKKEDNYGISLFKAIDDAVSKIYMQDLELI